VSYTELAVVFFMLAGIFDIVVTQSRMLARHDFWLSYSIILFFSCSPTPGSPAAKS
jgi:hypothetical protein